MKRALLLAVLAALALAAPALAAHAGGDQDAAFRQALAEFQAVSASEQKAAVRDNWTRALTYFREALNQDPASELGAKSLYYMGRVYQELGQRSFLHTDFSQAADFFQRAVNRFPAKHPWVDDCLYRKAEISVRRLDSPESAKADLKLLLSRFPDGDQADAARKLLAELTRSAPAAASDSGGRSGGPKPQAKAGINTAYYAAVKQFKAMESRKTARDQYVRASREFEEIAGRDPDGPFAGRALFYAASAAEAGGESGRKADDLRRAADLFGKAARAFESKDSWVDDCLMRRAKLLVRLGNGDLAYGDLLQIVHEFPKGDQAEAAKAMLRTMDEARAGAKSLAAPKAPEPAPTPAPAPASAQAAAEPQATPAPAGSGAATLTDVRFFTSDDYTRIVLDLDKPAAYEHHPLPADPAHQKSHRMYLDLKDTRLSAQASRTQDVPASFLQSVRAGQYDPATTRVVLDFQELKQYHVFALDNPYRIVIDVYASGSSAAKAEPKAEPEKPKAQAADKPKSKEPGAPKASAKAAPEPAPGERNKKVAGDVLAQLGMTIETVLIDAGHGGKDPGCMAKVKAPGGYVEVMEKNVTLHMAKILGSLLQSKGYKVMYTRDDDRYVSLEDRSVMGNLKKADLFISLHVNANTDDDVRGLETYFLGKARKDKELRLAAYENNVDPVKISDTQKIVLDLVHSFKIEESKVLADDVQKRVVRDLRAKWEGINDHGARPAPFFVLIGAKMPAILVEIGYLTNPAEAPRLLDESYLRSLAGGILDGIETYKRGLRVAGMGTMGG